MRLLAILCCLLPLSAHARTCRILFLGAGESDPEKLFLHDGTGIQEVELPRLNLSPPYKLPDGALTLRMLTAPPAEGEAPPAATPSAAVTEAVEDIYVLVTPDPANRAVPVRLQVIDATGARFRAGQMMWFNLTPNDVGGKVGSRQLALRARSRVVLDAPATEAGSYPVNLSFRIPGKDQLYPLCETQWAYDPSARNVVFVFAEAGSRTPRVMAFPDQREPEGKNP